MRFAIALRPLVSALATVIVVSRDAPVSAARTPHVFVETPLQSPAPAPRVAGWTKSLEPIEVTNVTTQAREPVRLYAADGAVDEEARSAFERIAAGNAEAHPLAVRLEQLVIKAAYHFQHARVLVVSGFRANAGRHGTGEALDFKLSGVSAARLAAYLRGLPRVGVGVYTHPRTQFVHLDVRAPSYHWIDASPPGVHWHEGRLRDPLAEKRDAAWTEEMDWPGL